MNKKMIAIVAIAVVVLGGLAYFLSGGDLFQGRLTFKKVRPNYISSQGLCIKPEDYEKKYYTPPSEEETNPETTIGDLPVIVDGSSSRTPSSRGGDSTSTSTGRDDSGDSTDRSNSRGGDSSESDESKKIVINPGIIGIGNNGSNGGNTVTGGSRSGANGGNANGGDVISGITPADETNYNWVECSCARDGYEWDTVDASGKKTHNVCYVSDWLSCLEPQYQCPKGTEVDWPALNDLCKTTAQKSCFGAAGPNANPQATALCSAFKFNYECVTQDECEEYAGWYKKDTLTDNMETNGIDNGMAKAATCSSWYNDIWNN